MKNEIDYIDNVKVKYVKDKCLKIEEEDLPITVILEGRLQYILKATPKGLVLNKKD